MKEQQKNIGSDSFSGRLEKLMVSRGMTQSDVASALSVSQGTVSGWMNGSKPQRRALDALSELFNKSPNWLLLGLPPEEKRPSVVDSRGMPVHIPNISSNARSAVANKLRQVADLLTEIAELVEEDEG